MLRQMLYYLGQTAMNMYALTLLDADVRYTAALPDGPKIFAANHPTTLDPFLLLTVTREEVSVLVTEFCFQLPVFGRYLHSAGHIRVVHSNGRPAFDEAVQRLNDGHSVGIFPEGALSPLEGGVCRAHTGVARLALATGAPIIPVGIALQRDHIHFRETHAGPEAITARWYFGGAYAMTAGELLIFEGDKEDRAYVRSATDQIMQRIVNLAAESEARLPVTRTIPTGTLAEAQ
jgi:1-acyl-sn-glycerol-3-phosphate acyltransferase